MIFTHSIWNSFSAQTDFPTLTSGAEADVVVIGGGITGITTAMLLAAEGKKTVVVEARKVGGGTTAYSTGNLYVTIDKILSSLQSKYNKETVQEVIHARRAAMDLIERSVRDHQLDCDFHARDWYLYSASEDNDKKIEDEFSLVKDSGTEIEEVATEEFPIKVRKAVKIPGQAQFNPVRYVQELAKAIASENCIIYENSRVTGVEEKDGHVEVRTEKGTVKAGYAVHATHTPKGVMVYHTILGPYREYGVAGKLRTGDYPEGIHWGFHEGGIKFSFRSYSRENERYIMAIGQPHKVGQAEDNTRYIQKLEQFLRDHFDMGEITHRWGGQHYRPADMLPYIGRRKAGSREFVATGFSTDGLTYGTLSAMIITDIIAGRKSKWESLFDSTRHQPLKAAKEFVKENLNVAAQYLKDIPWKSEVGELEEIKIGEGKILDKDGHKLAAYRTLEGEFIIHSAACTHMDCIVDWNKAEKTWDCPCHGSRFACDGTVLEGPAFHPLDKVWISGEGKTVTAKKKE